MATVTVEKNTYTVEPLYQWDLNQTLVIYGLSLASFPEVHFTNVSMGRAIVRQATMDAAGVISVEIPNSLLQKPYTVQAFVCTYSGSTFETQYKIEIPVNARSKPEDYTLEDDPEVYSFNALENQVNNALIKVTIAEQDYKEAEALANTAKKSYDDAVDRVSEAVIEAVEDVMADVDTKYMPRSVVITFAADGWVAGETLNTQEVTVESGTASDLVALQPTDEQLVALIDDGVSFLKVDNDNGTFVAKAGGSTPSTDMTIQATLTEVIV